MKKMFRSLTAIIAVVFVSALATSCKKETIREEIVFSENGVIWPGVYLSNPIDSINQPNCITDVFYSGFYPGFVGNYSGKLKGLKLQNTGPKKLYFVTSYKDNVNMQTLQFENELIRRGYKIANFADAVGMVNEYGTSLLKKYFPICILEGPSIPFGYDSVSEKSFVTLSSNLQVPSPPEFFFMPSNGTTFGGQGPMNFLVYR
jgi:hypothetical protein